MTCLSADAFQFSPYVARTIDRDSARSTRPEGLQTFDEHNVDAIGAPQTLRRLPFCPCGSCRNQQGFASGRSELPISGMMDRRRKRRGDTWCSPVLFSDGDAS